MEQRTLFFIEVSRALLDTKLLIILAAHGPAEQHAYIDP
jgi:uncharacterized protein (DUF2336 family)